MGVQIEPACCARFFCCCAGTPAADTVKKITYGIFSGVPISGGVTTLATPANGGLSNGYGIHCDLDADLSRGYVFYSVPVIPGDGSSNPSVFEIHRVGVDGTGDATIFTGDFVPTGIPNAWGYFTMPLAIDTVAEKVYFFNSNGILSSDSGLHVSLASCDYSGGGYSLAHPATDVDNPTGLSADHAAGRVFYSHTTFPDSTTVTHLMSCDLGLAAASEVWSTSTAPFMFALDCDFAHSNIVFSNQYGIYSIPYGGGTPTTISAGSVYNPGVCVDHRNSRVLQSGGLNVWIMTRSGEGLSNAYYPLAQNVGGLSVACGV